MLHDNTDIFHLMVHAKQVEESRLKGNNREFKKENSYKRGTYKRKLDIQYKPRFKKRFSYQVPTKFSKSRKDSMSNPRSQNKRGGNSPSEKPTCTNCGKKHRGEPLVGTGNYFGCGKDGHKVRDYPNVRNKKKGSIQAQASSPSSNTLKSNRFYALHFRGEEEESADVVTGMLNVFSIDIYDLHDPVSTLSFWTPLLLKKFEVLHDILVEQFMVTPLWLTPLCLEESLGIVHYLFPIE